MAKVTPKQLAQQTALEGDTDAAITQLSVLLEGGDLGAAASLAEIEAFRGQWPEMLRHAYAFMRKPSSVYAGNVLADVTNLVAVAGTTQGGWSDIYAEAVAIRKHLLSDPELQKYANGQDRMACGLDQLVEFAKTEGKSPYVWDWSTQSDLDEDARAAKFDAAIAEDLAKKKKSYANDVERRRGLFSLARVCGSYRSATRLYDEEGVKDLILFAPIAFTASALARSGRSKDAWQVVEKAVSVWWPVDVAQVAPVVLLTDECLRPLMTPERCEWVLRARRGPAAVSKKKS